MQLARTSGFSLIELVIVIMIIGVISAIAAGVFGSKSENSRASATLASLHAFERAAIYYKAEHGSFPPDAPHNQYPAAFTGYIREHDWNKPPPIGGSWDWNNNDIPYWQGFDPSFAVTDQSSPAEKWARVDQLVDDGSLETGELRRYRISLYMPIKE